MVYDQWEADNLKSDITVKSQYNHQADCNRQKQVS